MVRKTLAAIVRRFPANRPEYWAEEIEALERQRAEWQTRMDYAVDQAAKCRRALSWRASKPIVVRGLPRRPQDVGGGLSFADGIKRFSLTNERISTK